MHVLNSIHNLSIRQFPKSRIFNKKSILHLASRMILWSKQSIKVPKARFYQTSINLSKPHIQPDSPDIIDSFVGEMSSPRVELRHFSFNIIPSEFFVFPSTLFNHCSGHSFKQFMMEFLLLQLMPKRGQMKIHLLEQLRLEDLLSLL